MPAWFDIKQLGGLDAKKSINYEQCRENAARITKVIDEEIELHKGDSKKVLLGGFSQGAAMALLCGLEYPKPLGGLLIFSGFFLSFAQ